MKWTEQAARKEKVEKKGNIKQEDRLFCRVNAGAEDVLKI